MNWNELKDAIHVKQPERAESLRSSTILAFDPGHTTGWAVYHNCEMTNCGQIDTTSIEIAVGTVSELFNLYNPWIVVMEDYRIYKWRQKQHVGSDMLTTRVIGCIETISVQQQVDDIVKQPAQVAKGFCTDPKLKDWGFWQSGQRHARDAIRHGCYYILFGQLSVRHGVNMTTMGH